MVPRGNRTICMIYSSTVCASSTCFLQLDPYYLFVFTIPIPPPSLLLLPHIESRNSDPG